MTSFAPADLDELRDAITDALAAEEAVELVGGGSKRALGRPLQVPRTLDLSRLSGIRDYAPSELVLTAGAATPLSEIEAALAEHRQMLAFEPPDWDALLGVPSAELRRRTLGGVLACNLSGPRRIKAGAARDHFLGFRGVSGRGEAFKAGGKVVKNVTGYDLCKLMAGSYGTLAALEEVTVKVLPRPEAECTVALGGVAPTAATGVLTRALASPHEVSAAAYLPPGIEPDRGRGGTVILRIEGPPPSVAFRRERLIAELGPAGSPDWFADKASAALWRRLRDAEPLAGPGEDAVWRVSVPPSRGAQLGAEIACATAARWYLDWGGGLLWVAIAGREDGGAGLFREAIRGAGPDGGGHATLVRGGPALRRALPVFEPQSPALAALSRRVKDSFDPHHILNPGRMVEGV
ncbi:MAG: glycolate oxidase subunit GlcE [Alphaproteobacteria bacterium]|nr:glycolate oxidase subunit GlcE [Alphaproteobacteria bacterium]